MKTSSRRLLQVWIACCAILLNALAPAVSHALALDDATGRGWEICLNDGTRLSGSGELDQATFLALTDRGRSLSSKVPAPAPAKPMAMADCGYCLPNAGPLGMPPAMLQALPFAALPAERPFLFYHAPRPLQVWVAAHPRGPPADA
ncbi:DUF2946 domain-containing protein [Pseudoduganella buxea]|uniref:DUF2946 domain-containing protein n=1 Tax=Pseudoduganella buxea TaxID=1949069 RepID=A0A6I3T0A1_9BURK|nr:DUF2946 domain-containing protein [Pseudoduganella buxea]MTV54843.1 DUF2946 domain-containing protein [Pseudoduganella buxea]GGC01579.1 hypothetical protein GCM10011572_24430 [Pseudoduganella buxea]